MPRRQIRPAHMRHLPIAYGEVRAFCLRWQIVQLALFGSALRPADFHTDSDVDVLATFSPHSRHTLLDLVQMEAQLSDIIGRRVDLGEREAVERDSNLLRRQSILSELKVIYEDRPRPSNRHDPDPSADTSLHDGNV